MNKPKYESYKEGFKLLEHARLFKDLPHCNAAIAIAESVIADRCQSFLLYKEKEFIVNQKGRYLGTSVMIDKCKKHFNYLYLTIKQKNGMVLQTTNLFSECSAWLKARNEILHSFAKADPGKPTKNTIEFLHEAISTAEDVLRLASLIKKWHQSELRKFTKKTQ